MSIPTFLASYYNYYQNDNVTDVQQIIDDWRAQTLAGSPTWLNPTGNVFHPPADGYGRIFYLTFTRASATLLVLELENQSSATIMTRAIQIPSTHGCVVRYYWGDGHFAIDVQTFSTVPEYFWGGLLDMSPEPQNAHNNYVWGWGSRDVTGGDYDDGYFQYAYMMDDGVATSLDRICIYKVQVAGQPAPYKDLKGYRIFWPVKLWAEPASGVRRYCGRAYQNILVSAHTADVGCDITVPIDAGVNGTFRMLGGIPNPSHLAAVAIRVA